MNILVTGGAGFIGSHLCTELLKLKYNVTIIDDLSTGSLDNLTAIIDNEQLTLIKGSILDKAIFEKVSTHVDTIFHLAAAVGVKYILDNPLQSIHTNVMGTENVLEFAHKTNIKVILASTSEVYGKNDKASLSENDGRVLGSTHITRWSYSCSKALDEFMAFAYHRKFGLPIIITRLFNTCGPRQSERYGMVIPRFIKQAIQSQPITVHGVGEQIRSFTYVSDTVRALIALMHEDKCIGEVFNIGGKEPVTIKKLAELVKKKVGSSSRVIFIPYEEAYGAGFEDMQRRVPNIAKIKSFIDFEPLVGLDEILDTTIAYINQEMDIVEKKNEIHSC
ncbi:MAG: GDP-mannose 4,6-dehydratase [Candidatus Omnitrophica bacterium]|nr:GDP-mannose 4,6-dehydratase [Candidatus Omnitrophota bacterium]